MTEKTYWDDLSPTYHYEENRELKFLVDFLAANANSVFEAAVGSGIIATMLRKAGWKGIYLGSDYADTFITGAKNNNPEEAFIKVDLREKIDNVVDKSFDIAVVHHGLEYVYPYELALRELKRISKKYVVISMWVGLMPENNIRFNEEKKWNVNYYSREEFYKITKEIFGDPVMEAAVRNEDNRINNWYIFEV